MENSLPEIPPKRYFTIGEVSELCGVKPYVLRYWEQEFTQLRPMKRRGNRRYYQHHEVLLIRRIRDLLYEQGFTISGARNRLAELGPGVVNATQRTATQNGVAAPAAAPVQVAAQPDAEVARERSWAPTVFQARPLLHSGATPEEVEALRAELFLIRELLDW
ncbi:MAG: MerR family transcriptional regulator [Leptothrix sp. (in: b-proteobacteria)]